MVLLFSSTKDLEKKDYFMCLNLINLLLSLTNDLEKELSKMFYSMRLNLKKNNSHRLKT